MWPMPVAPLVIFDKLLAHCKNENENEMIILGYTRLY